MKKKKKSFPVVPTLLLSASALLLLGSTVGSTRAALTYYSENYSVQMDMSSIGVSLLENDTVVSHRDYTENGAWDEGSGKLLGGLLGQGEKIIPGKTYNEALSVQNTGDIDTFVRVIIKKSWQNSANVKDTTLSPDLIELNTLGGNSGWIEDTTAATAEQQVFYYTNALGAGATTPDLTDTIRIDEEIAKSVSKVVDGNTIHYVYDYNGYTFNVDAEVDAVQTHNAAEAIKSAWGVDVTVSADETTISLP
ncbi:MAG: hypothetical protein EOM40_09470 [Clostridia bacterium]|nr:hypothetical protein [Clostridia bacterium]NCC42396.1 hypothetical protein [Clostridia bacterium]